MTERPRRASQSPWAPTERPLQGRGCGRELPAAGAAWAPQSPSLVLTPQAQDIKDIEEKQGKLQELMESIYQVRLPHRATARVVSLA